MALKTYAQLKQDADAKEFLKRAIIAAIKEVVWFYDHDVTPF